MCSDETPCISGCVHWLLSSHQALQRGIRLPCLDSPPWVFAHTDDNPPLNPTLIWAEESQLSLPEGCPSVSITFLASQRTCSSSSISLLPWGAQTWTQHFRCSWGRAEQRGRTSPYLLATLFLAAQNNPGLFCCEGAVLAHGSSLSTRTSSKAAFQSPGPQHVLGLFYSTPGARHCLSLC